MVENEKEFSKQQGDHDHWSYFILANKINDQEAVREGLWLPSRPWIKEVI